MNFRLLVSAVPPASRLWCAACPALIHAGLKALGTILNRYKGFGGRGHGGGEPFAKGSFPRKKVILMVR